MKENSASKGSFEVVFDGTNNFPNTRSFIVQNVVPGNSYTFRVKAAYQNGFTEWSADSDLVWACSAPGKLQAPLVNSISQSEVVVEWSQPDQSSACPIREYALFLTDGASLDNFNEIDATQVRGSPYYTQHTITSASVVGATYLVYTKAFNVNGVSASETTAFVVSDVPVAPSSAPVSDLTASDSTKLKIDMAIVTDDGGSAILNYSLELDDGQGGDFKVLSSETAMALTTTVTDL